MAGPGRKRRGVELINVLLLYFDIVSNNLLFEDGLDAALLSLLLFQYYAGRTPAAAYADREAGPPLGDAGEESGLGGAESAISRIHAFRRRHKSGPGRQPAGGQEGRRPGPTCTAGGCKVAPKSQAAPSMGRIVVLAADTFGGVISIGIGGGGIIIGAGAVCRSRRLLGRRGGHTCRYGRQSKSAAAGRVRPLQHAEAGGDGAQRTARIFAAGLIFGDIRACTDSRCAGRGRLEAGPGPAQCRADGLVRGPPADEGGDGTTCAGSIIRSSVADADAED